MQYISSSTPRARLLCCFDWLFCTTIIRFTLSRFHQASSFPIMIITPRQHWETCHSNKKLKKNHFQPPNNPSPFSVPHCQAHRQCWGLTTSQELTTQQLKITCYSSQYQYYCLPLHLLRQEVLEQLLLAQFFFCFHDLVFFFIEKKLHRFLSPIFFNLLEHFNASPIFSKFLQSSPIQFLL